MIICNFAEHRFDPSPCPPSTRPQPLVGTSQCNLLFSIFRVVTFVASTAYAAEPTPSSGDRRETKSKTYRKRNFG